ncbi:Hypothetical predicted protein [Olea europaea subsp. europaea]|uniref:Uncharacterized protein n=1 Tax=Olea europaea subsp. europaea TaxID=158383 RepID=A0A8S0V8I6_OLEEU|nr:Hypothetical predicted protein [Olea europaea subsp. europaea]
MVARTRGVERRRENGSVTEDSVDPHGEQEQEQDVDQAEEEDDEDDESLWTFRVMFLGPFDVREYALISIFANAGAVYSGTEPALSKGTRSHILALPESLEPPDSNQAVATVAEPTGVWRKTKMKEKSNCWASFCLAQFSNETDKWSNLSNHFQLSSSQESKGPNPIPKSWKPNPSSFSNQHDPGQVDSISIIPFEIEEEAALTTPRGGVPRARSQVPTMCSVASTVECRADCHESVTAVCRF